MPTKFEGKNSRPVVNGRYRVHRITGVQRYAHEIVNRLGSVVEIYTPESAKGAIGHLWEQTMLPWKCNGQLLWSPCGSGPIFHERHVVTFHDLFPLEYPQWYSASYAKWYSFAMGRLAKNALHLIAVSEYTKSRLVALLGRNPDSITVIHNGLSSSCERATKDQVNAARIALKLPSRNYILSLSSLESRKNLNGMLEAWKRVYAELPDDTWLVLAGPKADEKVYGKQAIEFDLPRVLFTGYVPEEHLAGLYSGASLFVFPSLAEGFGLPLLEAMASGVRCITSNSSSLPEVGGDLVDYVDPRVPSELAEAILMRMRENIDPTVPYEPVMKRAGRFTWDAAAASTRDVLDAAGRSYVQVQQGARMAGL